MQEKINTLTLAVKGSIDGSNDKEIKKLLKEDPSIINGVDKEGYTPLMWAALRGDAELTKTLLDAGADANHTGTGGYAPLMSAVLYGHTSAFHLMMDKMGTLVDPEMHNAVINSEPFLNAQAKKRMGVMKVLLDAGAKVNHADGDGNTALMYAAGTGDHLATSFLLKRGADVNAENNDKNTALHLAAEKEHPKVARLLVGTKHVNVNKTNINGATPLQFAVTNNDAATTQLLLDNGAAKLVDHANNDHITPLLYAANNGNPAIVKLLLDAGADPDLADSQGYTPLLRAAANGQLEVIEPLLQAGARVDKTTPEGWTPLMVLDTPIKEISPQQRKAYDLVILENMLPHWWAALKQLEASINIPDNKGRTPLFWATLYGHKDMATWLLDHGAAPLVPSREGVMPLTNARKHEGKDWEEICNRMLHQWWRAVNDGKMGINAPDSEGKTLLYWAVVMGHKKMAEMLLDKGANPFIAADTGINPIEFAADRAAKSPQYKEIHAALHRRAFPWVYDEKIPEPARALLSGYRWPEGKTLRYTLDKTSFSATEPMGKKISHLKNGASLLKGERINKAQQEVVEEAFGDLNAAYHVIIEKAESPEEADIIIRQANMAAYGSNKPGHTDRIVDENGNTRQVCVTLASNINAVRNPSSSRTFINKNGQEETHHQEGKKVIVHEVVGHAVAGFGHTNETYTIVDTVMSYNHKGLVGGVYPSTPMPNDRLALEAVFRRKLQYRSGNDIYRIDGKEKRLHTVEDRGGDDTLEVSGNEIKVDLTPGSLNSVDNHHFALAHGTVIEDVTVKNPEGTVTLTDNDANNAIDTTASPVPTVIVCKGGDDRFTLGSGDTAFIVREGTRGAKHIKGFKPGQDGFYLASIDIPAVIEPSGDSTSVRIGDATFLLEGVPVASFRREECIHTLPTVQQNPGVPTPQEHPFAPDMVEAHPGDDYMHGTDGVNTTTLTTIPVTGVPLTGSSGALTSTQEQPCVDFKTGRTNIVGSYGPEQPGTAVITQCQLPLPPTAMEVAARSAFNALPAASVISFTDTVLRNSGHETLAKVITPAASVTFFAYQCYAKTSSALSSGCGTGAGIVTGYFAPAAVPYVSHAVKFVVDAGITYLVNPAGIPILAIETAGSIAGNAIGSWAGREMAATLVPSAETLARKEVAEFLSTTTPEERGTAIDWARRIRAEQQQPRRDERQADAYHIDYSGTF